MKLCIQFSTYQNQIPIVKRAARDKDLIKLWLCVFWQPPKKNNNQQTFFFFLCFFLLYFGFWRYSVNPIKTIPSAWIARASLRYCNFFSIVFFIFFSMRDAFFGQRSADVTVSPRQQEAPWFRGPQKRAAENVIIFSSYFEVRCQTSLLEQSGNGKWNVAFVKMLGAVFISPVTPCQIRGRCVQEKAWRSLAEPRLTRNNLPTASE